MKTLTVAFSPYSGIRYNEEQRHWENVFLQNRVMTKLKGSVISGFHCIRIDLILTLTLLNLFCLVIPFCFVTEQVLLTFIHF